MKKILITGANSYIGTHVEKWLINEGKGYLIDTLDVTNQEWVGYDFTKYNVVINVAAIVHKSERRTSIDDYMKVNTNLAYDIAIKSKESNVEQYIFLSSMAVYGLKDGVIDEKTILLPKTKYAKSKYYGENRIRQLQEDSFSIAIVRPPMVYGYKCKGNYTTMAKIANKIAIWPILDNERSIIHIYNLANFIKVLIDRKISGIFHPQNNKVVTPFSLVKQIRQAHNKATIGVPYMKNIINFLSIFFPKLNKVVKPLIYTSELSRYVDSENNELIYNVIDFEDSIKEAEFGDIIEN